MNRLSATTVVFLSNVGVPLTWTDTDQDTELQRTYLAGVMEVTVLLFFFCFSPHYAVYAERAALLFQLFS
jgi:hypothetical protein